MVDTICLASFIDFHIEVEGLFWVCQNRHRLLVGTLHVARGGLSPVIGLR